MLKHRIGVTGWWALALLGGSIAVAAAPRPSQVVTTQRAVVAPQAFKADDPVMKSPHAAKALSATMVSATFKNTPALKAFAELGKQAGYAIEPYNSGGNNQTRYGNVTATFENQPFWAAMREICARGNVGLYYYGGDDGDGKIQLMPSNYGQQHMMKAPASVQGPYLTVVTNLARINTAAMAAPDKIDRKVSLQIQTFAEPRARPMQYSYQPVIDEATDDNGNSMMPEPRERQSHMQSGRGISWNGHVELRYPTTNPGRRIARLRGHIDAKVQLASEPWEIADPLKAAETTKSIGGKKITFKSLKKSGAGFYTAEFVFHRGDSDDQQVFQQNMFSTQPVMKLSDPDEGRYQSHASGGRGDADKVTRQFSFVRRTPAGGRAAGSADPPEPDLLVIEVPTAVENIAIPFDLVDLPLP